MNFRGRFEGESLEILSSLTFQDCVEDLRRVLGSASYPPVLLAHGFGGLITQRVAEEEKVSALILISSLPSAEIGTGMSRALRLMRLKYSPLIFFRRPFRLEEKDFCRIWLAPMPEGQRAEILKHMVSESGHLAREFFSPRVEVDSQRVRTPVLIVTGVEDSVVPMKSFHEMAQRLRADLKVYSGHGHWIIGESEGEKVVRDIHRWLVQRLGAEIPLAEFAEEQH